MALVFVLFCFVYLCKWNVIERRGPRAWQHVNVLPYIFWSRQPFLGGWVSLLIPQRWPQPSALIPMVHFHQYLLSSLTVWHLNFPDTRSLNLCINHPFSSKLYPPTGQGTHLTIVFSSACSPEVFTRCSMLSSIHPFI